MTFYAYAHEGKTNPDSGPVETTLANHPLPTAAHREVWEALHGHGFSAYQIAAMTEARFPLFAEALRRAAAIRRAGIYAPHGGPA